MATTERVAGGVAPSEMESAIPTPTPAAEVERILDAAFRETVEARRQARAEKADDEEEARREEEVELREKVEELFGFTPEMRRSEDGTLVLAVAGPLTFVLAKWSSITGHNVRLREPCPDCDGYLYSGVLFDLESLGDYLSREERAYEAHDHAWREDSTHPNAPHNRPAEAPAAAPPPSLEEQLLELFRGLIRREALKVYIAEVEAREG